MNGKDILFYGNRTVLLAIEGVPDGEWITPGVTGYWSVKNIISHLASFEWALAELFTSLTVGGDTPTLDMFIKNNQHFNDIQVDEMRKDQTPAEALAEYRQAFARSFELFGEFPMEKLRQNGILPWYGAEYDLEDFLVYSFYGHKREHSSQIDHFRDDVLGKD
jgi:DinB superfamily